MGNTSETGTKVPSHVLALVQEQSKIYRDEATKVRARADLYAKLEAAIKANGSPTQLHSYVRELERLGIEKNDVFLEIKKSLSELCNQYFFTYGDRFRRLCGDLRLEVDGRFPSFLVGGVLHIEVDEENLRTT